MCGTKDHHDCIRLLVYNNHKPRSSPNTTLERIDNPLFVAVGHGGAAGE